MLVGTGVEAGVDAFEAQLTIRIIQKKEKIICRDFILSNLESGFYADQYSTKFVSSFALNSLLYLRRL